jgi:hypothetical protein
LCLLLTLVVVPVAYLYLSELQSFGWREWATRVLRLASPVRPTEGD